MYFLSVEIQMLLVEQCALFNAKMQEFEVGMDRKRQSLNDEKRSWLNFLKWKEDAVTCREEELGKLELHLKNKSERIKGKEKHLDANLRTLEEKGNLLKSDERRLDLEKKQMLVDKDSLQTFKDEIEKMRTDISQRESKIQEKTKNLKISEEERAEYLRMQAQLKEEIKFFEKLKQSEEDQLKNDRLAMEDHVKRELETLEIEKETFATKMRQEQSLISEKAQLGRRQMLNEFEQRRKDLEVDLQKKREELEAHMNERERAFMEEREREYNNINYLKEAAQKDVEESRFKRCRIEKDIPLNKKQLEENQLEKHKGINELQVPNKKVKVEVGEQFIKDREPFLFASSQDIASEKDDPTRPVEVTTCTSPGIQDLSAEGDVKLKTSETHDKSIEPVLTEKIECNEEVNSMIPERSTENGGDEYEVISEDEDMDEESEGRVPIHKKIWNFFVT
ncbi:nuclear matrix constituent protein 1-like [Daucus carota subsp. sativus]|uniref:nuclear matrix constituent protein 1-like n=1 Tax=Daucus carota subsp. sativus TaxID=79200 RepID=UPI003082875F